MLTKFYQIELHINANTSTPEKPGLIGQSLFINANQVLLSKMSTTMPTRPNQAKIYININQASLGKVSISLPTKHQYKPSLIGQSFYTYYNQALLGKVSTLTLTKPY